MNMELFRMINNLAYKNSALDKVMIFFSKDVPYIFMASLALVFIAGVIKNDSTARKTAVSAFAFTVVNLFISFIIGSLYYVDRPFVHNKVNLLFDHSKDAALPSDHATGTMSIALGLGKYNRALSSALTVLSLIVGFSRVYVGHHYPLDVISAYALALVTNQIYRHALKEKVDKLYEIIEKKAAAKLGYEEVLN